MPFAFTAPPTASGSDAIAAFEAALAQHADRLDLDLIHRALRFSMTAHQGQKRMSGEEFVNHSVAVATILLGQFLDTTSVVAALLHDVPEDTAVQLPELSREFGPEVAGLVEGLTKISHLTYRSSAEAQVENYRKLLLSIAKDARVIIIKLADRLHNMRTLQHLSAERQRRIAQETREIYAPLAHRFGMAGIKAELEDLAFKFLEPEEYRTLADQIAARREQREQMIQALRIPVEAELRRAGIEPFEVTGRAKHLWSIASKLRKRATSLDQVYDMMAVRVIVPSVPECYHVLGLLHHKWTPVQERFKDYIASPKSNGYQSLHTTLFGPGGHLYEVQIRTVEMHRTAEYGIAAHWVYKAGGSEADDLDRHFGWFRQLLELQQDTASPEEFLEFLKVDLFQDEIFVFTPQGDVKQLPKGATAIDFAFNVHSEVGLRCQGARVNGRIAPLHRELRNGDTVEILTGPQARPSRDWLSHVVTGRARHKIKQWIRQEEEKVSLQLGREILAREVRRRRLPLPGLDALAAAAPQLNLMSAESLEIAIGRGDLPLGQVIKALYPDLPDDELQPERPTIFGRVIDRLRLGRGVRIQGVDGLMVRYAQCCQPVPGDAVVGYVTQGRGISIHRADCPNLLTLGAADRRVDLDWQEVEGESFAVRLVLSAEDRRGLYADIMSAISQTGTNIRKADLHAKDGTAYGTIYVEVDNLPHLDRVMKQIRRVKGVISIDRHDISPTTDASTPA